jgi:glycosyltransferase involved in cell wall biosynthesis
MTPLVSILIPAYNAEKWIADALRSALAQTWPRKEIIVIDDGSTDGTLQIARQFASPCVAVIRQGKQGAAAARNAAFALSQGDYIQWLDADDLMSAEKIERQIQALERCCTPRTLASSAWANFRYRISKARFVPSALWCDLEPLEWMLRKWEHNTHMQTATWLARRELMEAAGPWDTRLLSDDDGEFFSRAIMRSDGIKFVPDARVYYRIAAPAGLSYIGTSTQKIDAQFLGMELQIGYVRSIEDSERVRNACISYLQMWLFHFYGSRPDIVERAQGLARSLGGELSVPELSWKYDWIRRSFGWSAVQQARSRYKMAKWRVMGSWDRVLFRLQEREINPSQL